MRRRFYLAVAAIIAGAALSGCTSTGAVFTSDYGARRDAGYNLPPIPIDRVDKKYHRQVVSYRGPEKPGTIVVDTSQRFLYLVLDNNKAMRYGIGVGRSGFRWSGNAKVAMKRQWPNWTPPSPMIRRQPELAKWAGGMPPGLSNPLGARALYLFNKRGDTGYRLHGTPEWNSIGKAVSSGCIRLMNQDIIDLYNRVDVGTDVVVRQ